MDKMKKGLYTIIGEGCVFEGTLTVPHDVLVDGNVKGGKIDSLGTVTVGVTGIIEADITSKRAIIGGRIVGNIDSEEMVELNTNASLIGNLRTKNLIINEGATFHGECSMDLNVEK